MIALPKAMSQGSNGAGGAILALTGISAARAEPEIIASAVANKIAFFILIPITFPRTSLVPEPPGATRYLAASRIFVNRPQSGTRFPDGEAKNTGKCRLFGRLSLSKKGCRRVWHSNNKLVCFPTWSTPGKHRNSERAVAHNSRPARIGFPQSARRPAESKRPRRTWRRGLFYPVSIPFRPDPDGPLSRCDRRRRTTGCARRTA